MDGVDDGFASRFCSYKKTRTLKLFNPPNSRFILHPLPNAHPKLTYSTFPAWLLAPPCSRAELSEGAVEEVAEAILMVTLHATLW
jgi:hypothetical protein